MGNLPFSRSLTLSPSDPVPSSLLNELQDMAISGRHGLQVIPYGGAQFRMRAGSPTLASDNSWTIGGLSTVVADMQLPVGQTISSLKFGYSRTAGNITFFLKKRELLTGTGPVTIVTKVVNSGSGYASTTLDSATAGSLLPYVVQADFQVWLECQMDTVGQIFNGGSISTFL